jgi:DNA topoisomerase-1
MVQKIYNKNNKYKSKTYESKIPDSINTAEYLIIVESPSKCKKIEEYLGMNYCCIASKGHIRSIHNLKSIDIKNNFQITFEEITEKKSHIEFMKKIIARFSKNNIILATDDDREGEAIAWHICKVFDLSIDDTKRIIFHEVTKPALLKAVENPIKINMNLVYAQHSRQILDLLVGFKISPVLWKYIYKNKENSLSAGRCQTPALRLVYDNEMERKEELLEKKYKITGEFFQYQKKGILFHLSKEFEKESEVFNFLEKTKDFEHIFKIESPVVITKSPPKPFNTSSLLQTASNILHMSPKETMSLCQQLYQDGHITYIRTDSMKYSGTFIVEATKYITAKYKSEYIGNLSEIENKDTSNPHEAIRVTHIEVETISGENTRMLALYKLIWRNTMESCMSNYKYTVQKANITAPLDLYYTTEIEIPIFLGWKKVSEKTETTNEQMKGTALLFFLETVNKKFSYNKIQASVSIRGTEKHYTEASLIKCRLAHRRTSSPRVDIAWNRRRNRQRTACMIWKRSCRNFNWKRMCCSTGCMTRRSCPTHLKCVPYCGTY